MRLLRSGKPFLNDCLYTGPSFSQSILLRFWVHKVALASDIEKALIMIATDPNDRDYLKFLWIQDITKDPPEIIMILRFTQVAFGVRASPFLLNATIDHHVKKYKATDPSFVENFLASVYVDDVSLGVDTGCHIWVVSQV